MRIRRKTLKGEEAEALVREMVQNEVNNQLGEVLGPVFDALHRTLHELCPGEPHRLIAERFGERLNELGHDETTAHQLGAWAVRPGEQA